MDLNQDFLKLIHVIANNFEIPSIDKVFIPKQNECNRDCKKSNFGAIQLDNGSTGIFFTGLGNTFHKSAQKIDLKSITQIDPLSLISKITSQDIFDRTLAVGTINAISHYLINQINFQFNYSENILEVMNIQPDDSIGMVGYFPPLVKRITNIGSQLKIVELKKELIKKTPDWEITLDKRKLRECNKIICTSTTVINNTLGNILEFTRNAKLFALIGPTAGFLPDPIFKRKIDILGGSIVNDSQLFHNRISLGEKWGDAVSKFVIMKENYPGIKNLINHIE
jgi:uncharacterized protein (DUF4213/DUF364 family)